MRTLQLKSSKPSRRSPDFFWLVLVGLPIIFLGRSQSLPALTARDGYWPFGIIPTQSHPGDRLRRGSLTSLSTAIRESPRAIVLMDAQWSMTSRMMVPRFFEATSRLALVHRDFPIEYFVVTYGELDQDVEHQLWLEAFHDEQVAEMTWLGNGELLWLENGRMIESQRDSLSYHPTDIVSKTRDLWAD